MQHHWTCDWLKIPIRSRTVYHHVPFSPLVNIVTVSIMIILFVLTNSKDDNGEVCVGQMIRQIANNKSMNFPRGRYYRSLFF